MMDHARRAVPWLLGVLALQAFYAVPYRLGELGGVDAALRHGAGVLAVVAGGGVVFALRRWLARQARCAASLLTPISAARWLAAVVAVGLVLRVAWVLGFGFVVESDGGTYLALAQKLAAGAAYETAGTRAYWPPGFPLFLSPFVFLFGAGALVFATLNLALFVVTVMGVFTLTRRLFGDMAAKTASLMLAVWPNFIGLAGVLEKETLIIALLPLLALLVFAHGSSASARPGPMFGAGVLTGLLCLAQPSFILFFLAPMLGWLLIGAPLRIVALRTALLVCGMTAAIAPWSYRNYQLFDQFVPISTNGGHNLYRANNPWADGAYQKAGARSHELGDADELTVDAKGRAWARDWIVANPGAFLALGLRKQLLFLGDSSYGMYGLRADDRLTADSPVWLAAKLVGNGFWLAMWALMLAALLQPARHGASWPPALAGLALFFLYFHAIHSVFESGAKYHIVTLGVLAALFGAFVQALGSEPEKGAA